MPCRRRQSWLSAYWPWDSRAPGRACRRGGLPPARTSDSREAGWPRRRRLPPEPTGSRSKTPAPSLDDGRRNEAVESPARGRVPPCGPDCPRDCGRNGSRDRSPRRRGQILASRSTKPAAVSAARLPLNRRWKTPASPSRAKISSFTGSGVRRNSGLSGWKKVRGCGSKVTIAAGRPESRSS